MFDRVCDQNPVSVLESKTKVQFWYQYWSQNLFSEIFSQFVFLKLKKGTPLPPPSKLKRKILIKNKRLKPEVEKEELAKYLKGELEIGNEESEDTTAGPPAGEGADPAAAAAPAHRCNFPAESDFSFSLAPLFEAHPYGWYLCLLC